VPFLVSSILGMSLVAGCPDRTISKVPPQSNGVFTKDIPISADIDILFVIDNSASTADKQTVFAQNFPKFVAALDAFPGIGRPNIHMAVVTTSVDLGVAQGTGCPHPNLKEDGRMQNTAGALAPPGCPVPNGRYIADIKLPDGTRQVNYAGALADNFSCIAQVGATGCGFESQLEAIKRALDGSRAENAGFLRPGAYLAVVILTDEDDASTKDGQAGLDLFSVPAAQAGPGDFRAQPLFAYTCDQPLSATAGGTYTNCKVRTDSYLKDPLVYAQFLSTIKDPNEIVVALIAGDPTSTMTMTGALTQNGTTQDLALEPSCHATINGNMAIARPGIRLDNFLQNFGDHGIFRTICQSDYSQALTDIGALLFKAVSPCLEGAINTADADPSNPGVQLDCTVSDVTGLDTASQTETPLRACKMNADGVTPDPASPTPCWYTKANPATCMTETGLEITFVRGGSTPAIGTVTQVSCATAPPATGP